MQRFKGLVKLEIITKIYFIIKMMYNKLKSYALYVTFLIVNQIELKHAKNNTNAFKR